MEVIKKYLSSFICLKKSSVVLILTLLFLGIFVPLEFADAAWWNPITWAGDAVLGVTAAIILGLPGLIFMFVIQLILSLSSFLVWLAGLLLATIINMDIPFTKCPPSGPDCFLDSAWTLTRDLSNMLLIVVLVVIAFATMLQKEGYGFKKALLPLIGVALLVNFSKVIVGVVVDISTVVMQIFLNEITGLEMLTSSFANQGKELLDYFAGFKFLTLSGNLAFVIKTIVFILFQLGFAFILGLYAIIFLVRYIAIWLLVILAPFAFLAFILPATRKGFTMWWSQLVSWSFVGVTMAFFLWLGKLFASKINAYDGLFSTTGATAQEAYQELFSSNPLKDFIIELLPYFMLLIFLYATFMIALKTNAMGANIILKTGKKWGAGVAKAGASLGRAAAWQGAKSTARGPGMKRVGRIAGKVVSQGLKDRMGRRVSQAGGFLAKPAGVAKKLWEKLPKDERKKLVDALLYRKTESKKEKKKKLLEKYKRGDITADEYHEQLAKIEERDEGPEEGGAPTASPSGGGHQTPGGIEVPPGQSQNKRTKKQSEYLKEQLYNQKERGEMSEEEYAKELKKIEGKEAEGDTPAAEAQAKEKYEKLPAFMRSIGAVPGQVLFEFSRERREEKKAGKRRKNWRLTNPDKFREILDKKEFTREDLERLNELIHKEKNPNKLVLLQNRERAIKEMLKKESSKRTETKNGKDSNEPPKSPPLPATPQPPRADGGESEPSPDKSPNSQQREEDIQEAEIEEEVYKEQDLADQKEATAEEETLHAEQERIADIRRTQDKRTREKSEERIEKGYKEHAGIPIVDTALPDETGSRVEMFTEAGGDMPQKPKPTSPDKSPNSQQREEDIQEAEIEEEVYKEQDLADQKEATAEEETLHAEQERIADIRRTQDKRTREKSEERIEKGYKEHAGIPIVDTALPDETGSRVEMFTEATAPEQSSQEQKPATFIQRTIIRTTIDEQLDLHKYIILRSVRFKKKIDELRALASKKDTSIENLQTKLDTLIKEVVKDRNNISKRGDEVTDNDRFINILKSARKKLKDAEPTT